MKQFAKSAAVQIFVAADDHTIFAAFSPVFESFVEGQVSPVQHNARQDVEVNALFLGSQLVQGSSIDEYFCQARLYGQILCALENGLALGAHEILLNCILRHNPIFSSPSEESPWQKVFLLFAHIL
ncbi:hypothetical protein [Adlercreutzia sp. ZJ242]|uniref:hypothetical protein n=1 Tax=Adlercreutzia sp. ZJ242 TaxID=2709409 RepID=UPI0013EA1EF8|nr:hypothetical protein [Adlercreutzia sp. ZJ242]